LRAAPVSVRCRYPTFSQLNKLVSDGNIVGQAGKPHAFTCVAHLFFFGGHTKMFPMRVQRERATFATGAAPQTTDGPQHGSGQRQNGGQVCRARNIFVWTTRYHSTLQLNHAGKNVF
jgi:hypothetical protein